MVPFQEVCGLPLSVTKAQAHSVRNGGQQVWRHFISRTGLDMYLPFASKCHARPRRPFQSKFWNSHATRYPKMFRLLNEVVKIQLSDSKLAKFHQPIIYKKVPLRHGSNLITPSTGTTNNPWPWGGHWPAFVSPQIDPEEKTWILQYEKKLKSHHKIQV